MNQEREAERPYDPDGAEEIWRKARKLYKPLRRGELNIANPRLPGERTDAFETRGREMINKEAISMAIDAMAQKGQIPNIDSLGIFLGLSGYIIEETVARNFFLRKKIIEATLRVRKSDILSATLVLLNERRTITYKNLADVLGKSESAVRTHMNDQPEIKDIVEGVKAQISWASLERTKLPEDIVDLEESTPQNIFRKAAYALLGKGHAVTTKTLAVRTRQAKEEVESLLRANREVAEEILDKDEFKKLFP